MQDTLPPVLATQDRRKHVAAIADYARSLLERKRQHGKSTKLSKKERADIVTRLAAVESLKTHDGVNFSRIDISEILRQVQGSNMVEFETLGPYLAAYTSSNGVMTVDNLIPEDAIGLQLAVLFHRLFPTARLVSLYDEYNNSLFSATGNAEPASFSDSAKQNFKHSLTELFVASGAISPHAVDGKDFLLLAESTKVADAAVLVSRLDSLGLIRREEEEIFFVNEQAENPLHRQIKLRAKSGKWLCEALDAATFLRPENVKIIHLVVLPAYMKDQQDKVWEILRCLGVQPEKYHNIFFDINRAPAHIAKVVEEEFRRYGKL